MLLPHATRECLGVRERTLVAEGMKLGKDCSRLQPSQPSVRRVQDAAVVVVAVVLHSHLPKLDHCTRVGRALALTRDLRDTPMKCRVNKINSGKKDDVAILMTAGVSLETKTRKIST